MKVVFICSANKDRSATAEELAKEIYPEHQYDSAGTNQKICFQLGTQCVTREIMEGADLVLAMENKHKKEILRLFGKAYSKKIKVLSIRDHYPFSSAELKGILKEKLQPYL